MAQIDLHFLHLLSSLTDCGKHHLLNTAHDANVVGKL
jgi:hypothetical protein